MPTYEYLCRSCGERLEVVQSFADDSLTVCDACGGELRKVFSAAGLIFKGSGWHVKDYASGSKGAGGPSGTGGGEGSGTSEASTSSAAKEASSGSSASSDTKSDTKSSASTDAKSGTGSGTKSSASD